MKKYLLAVAMLLPIAASADTHCLTIRLQDGTECSLPLEGLSITYESGQMHAESQGTGVAYDVNALQSMRFSKDVAGIERLNNGGSAEGIVYDLQGRRVTNVGGQERGVYIMKDGEGARKEICR